LAIRQYRKTFKMKKTTKAHGGKKSKKNGGIEKEEKKQSTTPRVGVGRKKKLPRKKRSKGETSKTGLKKKASKGKSQKVYPNPPPKLKMGKIAGREESSGKGGPQKETTC